MTDIMCAVIRDAARGGFDRCVVGNEVKFRLVIQGSSPGRGSSYYNQHSEMVSSM